MLLERTQKLDLNEIEYAYLKTIAFTSNDIPLLLSTKENEKDSENDEEIQQFTSAINLQACCELFEYIIDKRSLTTIKNTTIKTEDDLIDENNEKTTYFLTTKPTTNFNGVVTTNCSGNGVATPNCNENGVAEDEADSFSTASTFSTTTLQQQQRWAIKRYTLITQLVPCLKWFKHSFLVELFFSGLIGNLSIETVMPFILSMDILQIFKDSQTSTTSLTNTINDNNKNNSTQFLMNENLPLNIGTQQQTPTPKLL